MDRESLTPDQLELWDQVDRLWRLAVAKDSQSIQALLHPDYTGWVAGQDRPQNRAEAVESAVADTGNVTEYSLHPLTVQLYDGKVGVVHYRYDALVRQADGGNGQVTGRWTEIYLRQEARWLLVCVTGGPESVSATP
jgi:hypothetical protein